VSEDQAHLQEDFELGCDDGRLTIGKGFGAVPALQKETTAASGFGQLGPETFDLVAADQGGEPPQLLEHAGQGRGLWIDGLLSGRFGLPTVRSPVWGMDPVVHLSGGKVPENGWRFKPA
jgi:hypothetical protein